MPKLAPLFICRESGEGKIFSTGLFYRSDDAIYPYAGLTINNFQLGLTYDVTVSKLKSSSYPPRTFDLSLIYALPNVSLKDRKLIPWRRM